MYAILVLGLLSGAVQLLGYCYYILKTRRDDISPNPTTWLIFAFDTTLLTILEYMADASFILLILPATCSLGAIYIAWLVRKSGRLTWPTDRVDAYILSVGILIAVFYTVTFILWHFNIVPTNLLFLTGIIFLVLSNTNTVIAFVPIIREVSADPLHEHAGPWTIWTLAYLLLTVLTYLEVGFDPLGAVLYLYPVSCLILHGLIAVLARDSRKSAYSTARLTPTN